jgi:hypothetical protein
VDPGHDGTSVDNDTAEEVDEAADEDGGVLNKETGLKLELKIDSEDSVDDDVAAFVDVDVIGIGGKGAPETLSGSGTVPVIWLNIVHWSPL